MDRVDERFDDVAGLPFTATFGGEDAACVHRHEDSRRTEACFMEPTEPDHIEALFPCETYASDGALWPSPPRRLRIGDCGRAIPADPLLRQRRGPRLIPDAGACRQHRGQDGPGNLRIEIECDAGQRQQEQQAPQP